MQSVKFFQRKLSSVSLGYHILSMVQDRSSVLVCYLLSMERVGFQEYVLFVARRDSNGVARALGPVAAFPGHSGCRFCCREGCHLHTV